MVQAMRALQRMQAGREKTAAEIAAEGKLKASIVKNAEVIADHLKVSFVRCMSDGATPANSAGGVSRV